MLSGVPPTEYLDVGRLVSSIQESPAKLPISAGSVSENETQYLVGEVRENAWGWRGQETQLLILALPLRNSVTLMIISPLRASVSSCSKMKKSGRMYLNLLLTFSFYGSNIILFDQISA